MYDINFEDIIEWVKKRKREKATNFLEPPAILELKRILDKERDISYVVSGGYEGAERQVMVLFPDFMAKADIKVPIAVIKIEGNFDFHKISHRDVLGSLMGTGIKREKVGDILIKENVCNVIVMEDMVRYLTMNLTKVGNVNVDVSQIDFNQIIQIGKNIKNIQSIVASLRLDSVTGVAFSMSRTKASQSIRSGLVRVNWEQVINPDYNIKEGDVISFKGRGRAVLDAVEGVTKKGRISISINKYI